MKWGVLILNFVLLIVFNVLGQLGQNPDYNYDEDRGMVYTAITICIITPIIHLINTLMILISLIRTVQVSKLYDFTQIKIGLMVAHWVLLLPDLIVPFVAYFFAYFFLEIYDQNAKLFAIM